MDKCIVERAQDRGFGLGLQKQLELGFPQSSAAGLLHGLGRRSACFVGHEDHEV
jgi:hypothetical protein